MIKRVYSTSPYRGGSTGSNTMIMVIPAPIVKDQKIDPSSIFLVKSEANRIIIEKVNFSEVKTIPDGKSFQASGQQVSGGIH